MRRSRRAVLDLLASVADGRANGPDANRKTPVSAAVFKLVGAGQPFGDAGDYTWAPDGKSLVFSARIAGKTEAWSTNFDIYQVPAAGGSTWLTGRGRSDSEHWFRLSPE